MGGGWRNRGANVDSLVLKWEYVDDFLPKSLTLAPYGNPQPKQIFLQGGGTYNIQIMQPFLITDYVDFSFY
jgi:hypothetical protein